jgi:hypothetical protein
MMKVFNRCHYCYYRKCIYKYADKAKALHKITEKNQKFTWTEDCQKSFDALKQALKKLSAITANLVTQYFLSALLKDLQ